MSAGLGWRRFLTFLSLLATGREGRLTFLVVMSEVNCAIF
jgi:hypothetical protein